ncbi:UNVERIFIED_CONTAM: Retrovirus-related Pol polyprotein from transposon TNT 1-94 [Sesamum latifolium]|uniref:Retrovirus-related Pol polyprotein from transposon TNT 1-94 n=1 Tax=Sesamum latifolium TaxID=2727402 RepID=A0AAW2WF56_9LAMI
MNVFNQIITNLARLDVSTEDEDRAMIMLCSLPFSYEHIMTTLTYGKEIIKVDEITSVLLAHNQRKQNAGESSHGDSLYVKGNQDRGWKLEKEADEKRDDSSKSANVVQNDSSDCSDGDMLSVSTNQFVDAWILDSDAPII